MELVQNLSAHCNAQDRKLTMAEEKVAALLSGLDEATALTARIQSSVLSPLRIRQWWPIFVCPVVSLILGSYRLPPSGIRNVGLIVLGKCLRCRSNSGRCKKYSCSKYRRRCRVADFHDQSLRQTS